MNELSYSSKIYLNNFNQILNQMGTSMFSQDIINNITINFIRCMIPHHEAAIYMCQNLLRFTNNRRLINLANNIIDSQSKGIRTMEQIERTINNYQSPNQQVYNYMNNYYRITNTMLYEMKNSAKIDDINLDFITEMIPHHEGAINMCQNVLQYNIDPRLINLAQSIIREQSKNIQTLQEIRSTIVQR